MNLPELVGFNSSQVGYKLLGFFMFKLYDVCFNSSQVGYKLIRTREKNRNKFIVSIPHRLATNLIKKYGIILHHDRFQFLIGWLQTHPKKPIATLLLQFQFLIGWLQTIGNELKDLSEDECFNSSQVGYKLHKIKCCCQCAYGFQFLIGWLQTSCLKRKSNDIGAFIISIPYRLATNWEEEIQPVDPQPDFNSSQVGYKLLQILPATLQYIYFNSSQVGYKRLCQLD